MLVGIVLRGSAFTFRTYDSARDVVQRRWGRIFSVASVATPVLLGLCLGLAPLGSWVATTNTLPPGGILVLGLAVLCWTAGFDILYSCQDYEFDRRECLHSVPARFGIKAALRLTWLLHACTVLCLIGVGISFSLGPVFYGGVVIIGVFLWYENSIVSADDLSRLNVSFFTVNGVVSICAFVFTFVSVNFHL